MKSGLESALTADAPRATVDRYSRGAMLLHWLTAAMVLYLFWLGWTMVDLPKGPERGASFGLHKSIGMLVIVLTVVRLLWRRANPPPALPGLVARWQVRLSTMVHHGFYLMLLLHPLMGYVSAEFAGYGNKLFGIKLYNWGWKDHSINEFFTECHEATGVILLLLILIHLAGAISHAVKRGDHVVRRMLPW